MTLGNLLKQNRLQANLSLKDVSKKLNVSARHIIYIEKDERKPSIDVLIQMCKLYKMDKFSLKYFFDFI